MANVDGAQGFWPVRHLTGGDMSRTNDYIMTASTTIYKGDLLKCVAAGTVEPSAADDGVIVIGVAAEYKVSAASGTYKIAVYDDPQIAFGVQADSGTALTAAAVFATANHVAGSGSATTKLSGHELDSSDVGTGAQLEILGKVETSDNTWAEHVNLIVRINEHKRAAAVAGV
jgi:hypothetical protein